MKFLVVLFRQKGSTDLNDVHVFWTTKRVLFIKLEKNLTSVHQLKSMCVYFETTPRIQGDSQWRSSVFWQTMFSRDLHCKKKGRIINEKTVLDTVINGKRVRDWLQTFCLLFYLFFYSVPPLWRKKQWSAPGLVFGMICANLMFERCNLSTRVPRKQPRVPGFHPGRSSFFLTNHVLQQCITFLTNKEIKKETFPERYQ